MQVFKTETSLFVQLPPMLTCGCSFRYCAISMSSGREVSKYDENVATILEGIQPGDKYEVLVYEVKEKTERLIAKSIKQTKKFIGRRGGVVEVGCCVLDFPEGAIEDEAFIEIDRSHKNFPRLPENTISIAPIIDFRSTQRVFRKPVSCKITTPYITSSKPVEIEVICYEHGEWKPVWSGKLNSGSKVVKFKCDHFSPYTQIIPRPFAEIRNMDMLFRMRNRIYFNEDNIACVTYLDDVSIVRKFEPELVAFRPSSFVLKKSSLRIGEHFDFSLKSVRDRATPDYEFGSWRVTLDEEFIENDWSDTKVLRFDRNRFAAPVVPSQFIRRHSDGSRREYTEIVNMRFGREPAGGNVTQTNVIQGRTPDIRISGSAVYFST